MKEVDVEDEVQLLTLTSRRNDPIMVTLDVEKVPVQMEVDTGAGVSILPASVYDRSFRNVSLKPSSVLLRTFSGEKIKLWGWCK